MQRGPWCKEEGCPNKRPKENKILSKDLLVTMTNEAKCLNPYHCYSQHGLSKSFQEINVAPNFYTENSCQRKLTQAQKKLTFLTKIDQPR